jgi:hypothetical protein
MNDRLCRTRQRTSIPRRHPRQQARTPRRECHNIRKAQPKSGSGVAQPVEFRWLEDLAAEDLAAEDLVAEVLAAEDYVVKDPVVKDSEVEDSVVQDPEVEHSVVKRLEGVDLVVMELVLVV